MTGQTSVWLTLRGFEEMASVTIYTRDFCGFCARAKSLLESKGVAFTEFNATTNPDYRQEMMDKSGRNTFPQQACRRL
jgi:glutaredoxin 3